MTVRCVHRGRMDAAVRSGNLKVVQELIRSGTDVNEPFSVGGGEDSLLTIAIAHGHKDIALVLLRAGADVHTKDSTGRTPLHWACEQGLKAVVQALIDGGSRVNERDSSGRTPLMLADEQGDEPTSICLLQAGASCSEGFSELRETGLFLQACHNCDLLAVRTLFKNGCRIKKLSEAGLLKLIPNFSDQGVQELLHHACHIGDVFVVRTLLKNGSTVSILSPEEQEELLHYACRENDVFVVYVLLKYGCSASILSTEEQEKLLHHAFRENNVFVVCILLMNGCSASILSTEEREKLLCQACREGVYFVIQTLLKNGCSASILSREEQEKLLHHACRERDVFVVHILLKNDCSASILSKEEQERLFHQACHERDVFVMSRLVRSGCRVSMLTTEEKNMFHSQAHEMGWDSACIAGMSPNYDRSVHTLLMNDHWVSSIEEKQKLLHVACQEGDLLRACSLLKTSCSIKKLPQADLVFLVDNLPKQDLERLLNYACCKGDMFAVEALISSKKCNVDCVDSIGHTPLMNATENSHVEVVRKLILAGADLGMQTEKGYTALHIAAIHNDTNSGILLAEGGASVRIKNAEGNTPLDIAAKLKNPSEFEDPIKHALTFTTRKALCIIGNAESGKSTLIVALQEEDNSFWGKIFNQFRRVSDSRRRTAGIEIVSHCSQKYGEVLFFDFAGQDDYHGPHQMFLESLLSKPGVSMTLLLVVKLTEEEEAILHQLHRWLSPVAQMATAASPSQAIIIGSFLDKVKSKDEATAKLTWCIEVTRKDLEELPIEIVGSCLLNCRKPQSEGINQLRCFLEAIPIPEFGATHTRYSLAWVLSRIRSSFTSQAVQLQEFSMWVQDNKASLPRTMPLPEEVCRDLSAAGHALYLPNREDSLKSWLLLDLPGILHDMYGTLFSQSKRNVNEFGLLHCHHLAELFPHLDLEMVQQLLISLEFCLPVDPSILQMEVSELTQSNEVSGWLFFPALISAKPPLPSEILTQQIGQCLCWQLRTTTKSCISACALQTILLRLAAHFVVKHNLSEGTQQHCCRVWWNGIAWQSKKDVDVIVHITNNRVIQVIGVSIKSFEQPSQYLIEVISDIRSTVRQLSPNLVADTYVVHPPPMDVVHEYTPPPQNLIPVADIQNSIENGADFTLSLKNRNSHSTKVLVSDLFGGNVPSLEDIKRINWTQPEPNQPQSPSGPNQPEPSLPQPPLGPNQPEPNQPRAFTGANQSEPSLRQLPTGPRQPEPTLPQTSTRPTQQRELLTVAPIDSKISLLGAQALLDVFSTPTMRDMEKLVVTPVAANWQRVALRLGVDFCLIKVIDRNHPNDCEGACRNMLDRWLRGETGEADHVWCSLLTALEDASFVELVRSLRRDHFHP